MYSIWTGSNVGRVDAWVVFNPQSGSALIIMDMVFVLSLKHAVTVCVSLIESAGCCLFVSHSIAVF